MRLGTLQLLSVLSERGEDDANTVPLLLHSVM